MVKLAVAEDAGWPAVFAEHKSLSRLVADVQGVAHIDAYVDHRRSAMQGFDAVAVGPALQRQAVAAAAGAGQRAFVINLQPDVGELVEAGLPRNLFAIVERSHQIASAQDVERVGMRDEGTHVIVGRVEHDVFRLPVLHDAPAFHDRDVATEFERLVQIVADENDGLLQLALQFEQFVLQSLADQRVER